MPLTLSLPKDVWIDRFMTRASELIKTTTPEEAWMNAQSVFEEAADLLPEEAAEIFALEMPPADPGAPGD